VVVDEVFEPDPAGGVIFREACGLDENAVAELQGRVRWRILRTVIRRGVIEADDARAMGECQHGGGFSVDASVCVSRLGITRGWSGWCATVRAHLSPWSGCGHWIPSASSTLASTAAPAPVAR
jgi:hypothetical protein